MKKLPLSKRLTTTIAAIVVAVGAVVAFVVWSKALLIRGEDVTIVNGNDTLAATLALPRWGTGPFPALVVVHGSGRVTRRDLRAYGGQFVPEGIAVLFYDQRGVGKSTGSYRSFRVSDCQSLFRELADDVTAAVRYLKDRPEVDADRIGLIGGSQAGWVMPLAASQTEDIAFVVNIAGPAVTCGQVDYYQRLTGVNGGTGIESTDDEIQERVAQFPGPHGYDPLPVLEGLSVPMLWILGARDLNVPTAVTHSILNRLIQDRHVNHTVRIYPNADHDLHHAITGRLMDPRPDILEWLASIAVLSTMK